MISGCENFRSARRPFGLALFHSRFTCAAMNVVGHRIGIGDLKLLPRLNPKRAAQTSTLFDPSPRARPAAQTSSVKTALDIDENIRQRAILIERDGRSSTAALWSLLHCGSSSMSTCLDEPRCR